MHLAINIESNRLQAATVDLDGNVVVFKIGDGLDSSNSEIPCNVYIKGINAYVGDIVELIKYEDPNIKTIDSFPMELSKDEYFYEDDSQRRWSSLCLMSLIIRKLIKDIEINTMQTIESCNIGISSLYNKTNISDLNAAIQYNGLKLLNSYRHNSSACLYLKHHYQMNSESSVLQFFADWDYIQLSHSYVSKNQISHHYNYTAKIESIQNIKRFLIGFIQKSYQEQTEEAMIFHASNSVIINEIIKNIFEKFYIKNELEYENSVLINNNIILIKLFKSDFEEVNENIRKDIINAFTNLCKSFEKLDHFDFLVFTGKLGSLFFFRDIFNDIESVEFKQKIFSPKNDILVKGLALFNYEPYKILDIETKHRKLNPEKLFLRISSSGLEKTYKLSSLLEHDDQSISLSNILDDGMIKDLSDESCEYHVFEKENNIEKRLGKLSINLLSKYPLTHFQLKLKINQKGALSFSAMDVFNNQKIDVQFIQEHGLSKSKVKEDKRSIQIKSSDAKAIKIKVLSKNGKSIDQETGIMDKTPKRIKIGGNNEETQVEGLKIKIKKEDLKPSAKLELKNQKIEKNENTILEDFHELIRIIVINNSP